jgi:hypothetical protein
MSRSYLAGGGIPNQRRKALEEAAEAHGRKSLITQPDAESLNGVGDYARVKGPELVDLVER